MENTISGPIKEVRGLIISVKCGNSSAITQK